jgi:hypothetical protein
LIPFLSIGVICVIGGQILFLDFFADAPSSRIAAYSEIHQQEIQQIQRNLSFPELCFRPLPPQSAPIQPLFHPETG